MLIIEPKLLVFTVLTNPYLFNNYISSNQNKYWTYVYVTQTTYFAVYPVDETIFEISKIICMFYHWVLILSIDEFDDN